MNNTLIINLVFSKQYVKKIQIKSKLFNSSFQKCHKFIKDGKVSCFYFNNFLHKKLCFFPFISNMTSLPKIKKYKFKSHLVFAPKI